MSMTIGSRAERARRREDSAERIRRRAEEDISRAGRSMKCAGTAMPFGERLHANTPNGCKNDGSSCICECHDPKE